MKTPDELLPSHMQIAGQHEFDLGTDPDAEYRVDRDPGRAEKDQGPVRKDVTASVVAGPLSVEANEWGPHVIPHRYQAFV